MIRTVDNLFERFRSDVYDHGDIDDDGIRRDTLWSDDDLLEYSNAAAARWASDTHAYRRRFEINVDAGSNRVRFPFSEILDELNVTFSIPGMGRRRVLHKFDIDEGLTGDDYGQQIYTAPDLDAVGMPTHYTRDYDNQYLRLWKVPYMAGVMHAHAIALPPEMHAGMLVPFQSRLDVELVLLWMKKLAYAKQDADTLDLDRSLAFEAEYHRTVLDRASEIDRTRRDAGIMHPA